MGIRPRKEINSFVTTFYYESNNSMKQLKKFRNNSYVFSVRTHHSVPDWTVERFKLKETKCSEYISEILLNLMIREEHNQKVRCSIKSPKTKRPHFVTSTGTRYNTDFSTELGKYLTSNVIMVNVYSRLLRTQGSVKLCFQLAIPNSLCLLGKTDNILCP